jgi:hypothetical protein
LEQQGSLQLIALHRIMFFRPATGLGQLLPPNLTTAMEGLASTPDAKEPTAAPLSD